MPINHKKQGCHEELTDSTITIKDRGSSVKLDVVNENRGRYLKTRVDGGYLKGVEAADYMLSCCVSKKSLLVELKGNNTAKGCDQIISTYQELKRRGVFKDDKVPGVIVGTGVRPKAISTIAVKKTKYSRMAQKKIHIHNKKYAGCFDSFF